MPLSLSRVKLVKLGLVVSGMNLETCRAAPSSTGTRGFPERSITKEAEAIR